MSNTWFQLILHCLILLTLFPHFLNYTVRSLRTGAPFCMSLPPHKAKWAS